MTISRAISCEPVSTFDKRPFCLDNFELCNFKQAEGKQQNLSTTLARCRYRFIKSSVLALSLYNYMDVNVKSLGYISELRNNSLRCKTPILCNGSVFKFPTQFLKRNSRGNLSLHLNYHISWCYSIQ